MSYISTWIEHRYGLDLSVNEMENAFMETVQGIILQSLAEASFFDEAAFYGGTCLRMCFGLDRYSEDLDFSLKVKNPEFSLERFFPSLQTNLSVYGLEMDVSKRIKRNQSQVQSAFVKGNTLVNLIHVFSLTPPLPNISKNKTITVKFEVDTDPPEHAAFSKREVSSSMYPIWVLCYDLSSQLAGKIDAILLRGWKNRVKGRDYYDYLWFLKNDIPVNTDNLISRLKQHSGTVYSPEDIKEMLYKKFRAVNFQSAMEDVLPFVSKQNAASIKLWDAELFSLVTENHLVFG